MFFDTARLEFESKPDKPDRVYARTAGRVIARCLRFRRHYCPILIGLLSSSGLGVTD